MILPQPPFPSDLIKLLEPVDHHLAARAVLERSVPGDVIVDDPAQPSAALIRAGHRFHLCGSPDREGFNQSLKCWFDEQIFPQARDEGFTLYYSPSWEKTIENEILAGRFPLRQQREYYELTLTGELPQPEPLEGYQLLAVDRALLADDNLEGLDDLKVEMKSERASVEEFLDHSFGIAIRCQQALITWCLSEYNWDGRCEVGIATQRRFRRQGLATLAGRAFLALAFENGIERVGWHCYAANLPSGATARKLGLHKKADYNAMVVLYHLPAQLALHGSEALDSGLLQEALGWFDQALAMENPPAWAFFEAGRLYAMLNENRSAFNCLYAAASRGFNDRSIYLSVPSLDKLRQEPEWEDLMKKLG